MSKNVLDYLIKKKRWHVPWIINQILDRAFKVVTIYELKTSLACRNTVNNFINLSKQRKYLLHKYKKNEVQYKIPISRMFS